MKTLISRKFVTAIALGALPLGALAGVALADQPKAPVAGKTTLGLEVSETDLVTTGWRASKLIGADVRNDVKKEKAKGKESENGTEEKGKAKETEKIGKIDDLVIAPDGTLSVAVIEVGGFLGMGGHLVAVPMRQLILSPTEPKVTLPGATKDALQSLPPFKYAK